MSCTSSPRTYLCCRSSCSAQDIRVSCLLRKCSRRAECSSGQETSLHGQTAKSSLRLHDDLCSARQSKSKCNDGHQKRVLKEEIDCGRTASPSRRQWPVLSIAEVFGPRFSATGLGQHCEVTVHIKRPTSIASRFFLRVQINQIEPLDLGIYILLPLISCFC